MKKEQSKKYRIIQALRILSQAVFFFLFFYLLLGTHFTDKDYIGRVEIFFHFDPLLALATSLASRAIFASFILALITAAVTIVLGRYVCGWVCPLGAVHQFFSFIFKKTNLLKVRSYGTSGLSWKYVILIFIFAGSLFTLDLVGWLDPLSFLYRSFSTAVIPGLTNVTSSFIGLLYNLRLSGIGNTLTQFIEHLTLNATFYQGFFLGLIFIGVVFLNMARERFWCRSLCPLGALLSVLARWNIPKVRVDSTKCIKCNLCTLHCETQANPYPNEKWQSSECIYCYTCAAICPTAAVNFPVKARPESLKAIDLSRRKLILTTVMGLVAVPLFRITPSSKRASEKLIRPPGALAEEKFLQKCVKCGECMKACPTNGLQPALTEAEPEGIWTPMLVPKIGYCEYYCSLCTQVCPTGAIKELTVEEKIQVRIGTAWVKKHRCIPYMLGTPCIVCEEHCPTSPKAIKLVRTQVIMPDGTVKTPMAPVVDLDLCIGCGICEYKCPVVDEPAIYCTSVGEQRSDKNRLLLEVIKQEPPA